LEASCGLSWSRTVVNSVAMALDGFDLEM